MADGVASLSIGVVAERTGLSVHALRFYEREGILLSPVHRDAGGRRVYSDDDVDWLGLCIILRASGMPLSAIRRYAELVREGTGNEPARLELLREHRRNILAQVEQLGEALDIVNYKVGVYEDFLEDQAAGQDMAGKPRAITADSTGPSDRRDPAA